MNWEAIKHIYCKVLIDRDKIEYLSEDKYRLTSFYPTDEKHWEIEYKNEKFHGKFINWWRNGNKYWEEEYQNGKYISSTYGKGQSK